MLEVEVQAHADGIGRDQEIHFARLVHGDLRVAHARRERAEHHGRAASAHADQVGELVHLLHAERDHGAAPRQGAHGALARVAQRGQPWQPTHVFQCELLAQQTFHGVCAQKPRLAPSAVVEHAVREHVAALGVRCQLDLVDGHEVHLELARHGLHRADEVLGPRRHTLLFAGDQRHRLLPHAGAHTVIDLACEQAQRQAHHAGLVLEHALDGAVRLARVRGPEQRVQLRREWLSSVALLHGYRPTGTQERSR